MAGQNDGSRFTANGTPVSPKVDEPWYEQHPGLGESLLPVWGSGREAVADLYDHDYLGAGLNAGLAAVDAFGATAIASDLIKGAKVLKFGEQISKDPNAWRYVRKRLGNQGFMQPKQIGHHWAIPQKGWGEVVPNFLKNHPLNIKPMPPERLASFQTHNSIHGGFTTKPYGPIEKYVRGTPAWFKAVNAAVVGHPVGAATAYFDEQDQN